MPLSEKPAFLPMLDAVAERIHSDTVEELKQQVMSNPSVVKKFLDAVALFDAIANTVAKNYLKEKS